MKLLRYVLRLRDDIEKHIYWNPGMFLFERTHGMAAEGSGYLAYGQSDDLVGATQYKSAKDAVIAARKWFRAGSIGDIGMLEVVPIRIQTLKPMRKICKQ